MSKPIVYIDGKEGTTGLQIYDRLAQRQDIDLLLIDEDKRKDAAERKKCINAADIVFLCLPDAAAREAVALVENDRTRIIDASTAHRTAEGWAYGFAELSPEHRAAVAAGKRVANPGCHATGFISAVYPLVKYGLLPPDYPLTCFSLTGYSGGGKKMIAEYEVADKGAALYAPQLYGLNLEHKHLPEMQKVCSLLRAPVFCPIVDDYYKGMATSVTLHTALLPGHPTAAQLHDVLEDHYSGAALVSVAPLGYTEKRIAANTMAGSDRLQLIICGHEDQVLITALFDNLGKGASGAAVQNMNLMLGLEETTGLNL
ncbi:N-acetyl-gamma-glutamyl-phosphate reductase [bacterium 210917-DFI.7.65]|nr:N-acetyl-gamma-glutamyl-phosphate reductase [Clostridiales bacterium]MCB6900385.1 N-acetyl-gamma-glutamyl-phosphate reductase [bacterium 210917-DFI.7.65]